MKDIRAIFLYLGDKLLYKQIFHIIEKEIQEETGTKYLELPDEEKLYTFLKNVEIFTIQFSP
jgi:hypothetical protein